MSREPVRNNSVTALLINFLKQHQLWDGFHAYHFGDEQTKKLANAKVTEKREVYRIEKALPETTSVDAPVIRKTAELLWGDELHDKLKHGRLMHEIMCQVRYADDLDKVLNKFFAEGLLDEVNRVQLQDDLDDLLRNEKLAACFMPPYKVVNERGIMTKDKIKIPDRVVFNETSAVIIDYKTGEPDEDYKYQLNGYAKALKNFGFTEIKKLVVYLDKKLVVEI